MAYTQEGALVGRLEALRPQQRFWVQLLRLARTKPLGLVGLLLVLVLVVTAVGAPVIAPYAPTAQHSKAVMVPPSSQFWLGTDNFGRDLLSRIIYGAQISLQVGLVATVIGTLGGAIVGIVSGYVERRFDLYLQRVMDAWLAFPGIIFALSVVAALSQRLPPILLVMVAIGLSHLPSTNRVIRGATLAEKQSMYVEAARTLGAGPLRIIGRHILPNVTAPIIVMASIELGAAILTEASLSFLGVGIQPPAPSWGNMLSGAHRTYMLTAPWMALFPGIALTIAIMGWNLFGDALRDLWDPRLRGR